jgi:hypothetical protein
MFGFGAKANISTAENAKFSTLLSAKRGRSHFQRSRGILEATRPYS